MQPIADALADLVRHLEREADIPGAWLASNAPSGDLSNAWASSTDAIALLTLAVRRTDYALPGRVAFAAARVALEIAELGESRWMELLDDVERSSTFSDLALDEVGRMRDGAVDAGASPRALDAIDCTIGALEADDYQHTEDPRAAALTAIRHALRVECSAFTGTPTRVCVAVRAQLICPTLDQIRTEFRTRT
jgi:hypothetical protein